MNAAISFPDISPEIFTLPLFGMEFALRWYALAYIVGLLGGWWIVVQVVNRARLWPNDTPPMAPKQVEDLLTWVILGVILGGRLGYVLFYRPGYFLDNPTEILRLWEGGMSFHGGFAGVIIAGVLYCRAQAISLLQTGDSFALAAPLGLGLGRIANFINAELWGRPTDMPWGVEFPGTYAQDCGELLTLCARHPSQLYEALLEGILLGAVLFWLAWKRGALKTPGLVMGIFIAGYGAARFIVEFFRQPDAQFITDGNPLGLAFQVSGWGITMGQALSLPMIAVGLWFALRARKSGRRPA